VGAGAYPGTAVPGTPPASAPALGGAVAAPVAAQAPAAALAGEVATDALARQLRETTEELARYKALSQRADTLAQQTGVEPQTERRAAVGGLGYYWYGYRTVRAAAVIAAIAVVGLLAWLLFIRSDSGADHQVIRTGGGPVPASEADLVGLAQRLGQPVYWAGPIAGTTLEATQSDSNFTYVRYLTGDAQAGDPAGDFLTVGTYPITNGWDDMQAYARRWNVPVTHIPNGGVAVPVRNSPTSVFIAYPHKAVQVEIYDPKPDKALSLATSGAIKPVSGVEAQVSQ
jgi:hypothetical protein